MLIDECLETDEIFTHVLDGKVSHSNASAMARSVEGMSPPVICARVAMDYEFVDFVTRHRGVEEWKVLRLCEPYLSLPIIGVTMADGSVLTVDGHHRLVALARAKRQEVKMYIFPLGTWGPFVLEDVPIEFSDLLASEVSSDGSEVSGGCHARS